MAVIYYQFPPQSSPGRPSDASGLAVLVKKGIENQRGRSFFHSRGQWLRAAECCTGIARDTPLRSTALRCHQSRGGSRVTAFASPATRASSHLHLIAAGVSSSFPSSCFSVHCRIILIFWPQDPDSDPGIHPIRRSSQGAKAEEPKTAGPTTPVPYIAISFFQPALCLSKLSRPDAEKALKRHCIALQLQLRCSVRGVVETIRYSPEALRQTGTTALSIASAVVGHGVLC